MTSSSLADASLTAGSRIGRYFNIVSMLPTLFLVLWTYALLASHPWQHAPDLQAAKTQLSHWSAAEVTWILLATLLLALFLHPLQFATTQLLEGYWGTSRVALWLMAKRIQYHRKRRRHLEDLGQYHSDVLEEQVAEGISALYADSPQSDDHADIRNKKIALINSERGDAMMIHIIGEQAAEPALSNYPEADRVLPTRLGNTLRSFEDTAGKQYGLDAITTAPHFFLIAPERHMQYVRDSREQLDAAVKLCTISLIATAITAGPLLLDGIWLLIALAPYSLAYFAYRATIAAAQEYAVAVKTVIDLNRFALYESLRVGPPKHTKQERTTNKRLMKLLQGSDRTSVRYHRPPQEPAVGDGDK
ncbi:MAG TPA: hypothetical protein VHU91_01665 [Mycobacteriales bacterium]|jgi:hypothetical protein|nr:hypothetical protein [Mycobacteriales bacterium]